MAVKRYPAIDTMPFGGTGKDGAFDPQSNYDYSDSEGSWIVKEYASVNIDNGIIVSTTNRVKGLIMFVRGDVTINGEIDLDGKGYGADDGDIIPNYYANYFESGILKNAIMEKCASMIGGDGGGGGGGGYRTATVTYDALAAGDKAGGASRNPSSGGDHDAVGWQSGLSKGNTHINLGGTFNANAYSSQGTSRAGNGGGAYKGIKNSGGHGGGGGGGSFTTSTGSHGANATLSVKGALGAKGQGNCGDGGVSGYASSSLIIICAGNLTFGATCDVSCNGENGSNGENADSATYGSGAGGGGGGGGVQAYLYQGALSLDGGAARTVAGGTKGLGGTVGAVGTDGGDGSVGTIVTQQIPRS